MRDQPQKEYYGILPASVRHDRCLSDGAKVLYAEITTLVRVKGYCWATNEYFAKSLGKSLSTTKRYIAELLACEYIAVEISHTDCRTTRTITVQAIENMQTKSRAESDPHALPVPSDEEILKWVRENA